MNLRYFFGILILTFVTGTFVFVRLEIVRISYDIHEAEKREARLRDDCNALTLAIDRVKSPDRLERLAKDKFNMQPAKAEQIIVLR
jgi:cell division protein FtsL